MKLYDYFRSSASYRARIALNLKNISYESLPVHLTQGGGEQHRPDYLTINPQGLVPTLDENGHILSQSLAIIEYLEDICPTPALLPPTPLGRGQVRSLSLLIACDMHPLNNLRALNYLRENFSADENQIIGWIHHWMKAGFDAFENRLSMLTRKNPVCYGSEITMADVCLIPQVYNANRFEFSLEPYPLIREINAHCLTLPAFTNASPEKQKAFSEIS